MYEETTRSIRVMVEPMYLEEQSAPEDGHFVWAYRIVIENQGRETVQLLSRHWWITDGLGRTQEVHGPGVVGRQPVIRPGESCEYTSGTPLNTPTGIMVGTYEMESETGERFEIRIPAFSLDSPHSTMPIH